jgi:hypothetical protein
VAEKGRTSHVAEIRQRARMDAPPARWRARKCGPCHFRLAPAAGPPAAAAAPSAAAPNAAAPSAAARDPSGALAAPSAAAVLAFGCAAFAGRAGILEHVARAAAAEQIHSASAYCERCRETTWLCDAEAASLDAAVVDFALNVQRARAVEHALAVARARNRVPAPS